MLPVELPSKVVRVGPQLGSLQYEYLQCFPLELSRFSRKHPSSISWKGLAADEAEGHYWMSALCFFTVCPRLQFHLGSIIPRSPVFSGGEEAGMQAFGMETGIWLSIYFVIIWYLYKNK